jgi:hypothetical protein
VAIRITKPNTGEWRIGHTDVVDRLQWFPRELDMENQGRSLFAAGGSIVGGREARGSKRKKKITLRYKSTGAGSCVY